MIDCIGRDIRNMYENFKRQFYYTQQSIENDEGEEIDDETIEKCQIIWHLKRII